ncbi:ribonuclease H-like YkuK family protein [Albibacterium indicum]|uniref:ribonuclease H-like YkuK family protein n=1 Tax=Albibacterium indicum TaxID=2292082 RepID=UPI000E4EB85A|nr:ribonuclease H-like YkuK family protein [Pedobacter indicus]
MTWKKFNGETLGEDILEEVNRVIANEYEMGNHLKVCIGTDSQVKGSLIDFATVIVFVREKKGAFMFIHQEKTKEKMTIKTRMLAEVQRSIMVAYDLCPLLDRYHIDLEVHADINTNPQFKSNQALHDAMGYILGMGFVFKAKPEAFASSACANKMVQ